MIHLEYHPMNAGRPLDDAAKVAIAVTAVDARTENQDRIANRESGFFPRFALPPLRASVDLVGLLRDAVTAEMRARGFRVGAGLAYVQLDLTKFFHTPTPHMWRITCNGEVSFRARVLGGDGAVLYDRAIADVARKTVGFGSMKFIAHLLEEALAKAVATLMADPAFTDAVFKSAGLKAVA